MNALSFAHCMSNVFFRVVWCRKSSISRGTISESAMSPNLLPAAWPQRHLASCPFVLKCDSIESISTYLGIYICVFLPIPKSGLSPREGRELYFGKSEHQYFMAVQTCT